MIVHGVFEEGIQYSIKSKLWQFKCCQRFFVWPFRLLLVLPDWSIEMIPIFGASINITLTFALVLSNRWGALYVDPDLYPTFYPTQLKYRLTIVNK